MTNEEAIKILKTEYLGDFEEMELAKYMGWNALEKQIAKKPKQEDCFTCPSCENYLIYGDKYCQECGQLICWDLEGEEA